MPALPILISGAGPSGLILALSLAQNGVPVRIIDKALGPKPGERGIGISPRSLEVHRLLGTLPDILDLAQKTAVIRHYDLEDPSKIVKTITIMPTLEPTPQIPYINPVLLDQPTQERIFISHLEKLGVSVEFGSELRSFQQTSDSVTGEIIRRVDGGEVRPEEFKASWLVGTDGAHSFVRKELGLSFLGETREGDVFVLAEMKIRGEKPQFWDRWGEPSSKMAHLRGSIQDDQMVQLILAGSQLDAAKVSSSPEAIIEEFYSITRRRDIVIEEVVWSSVYTPNIRMVKEMRVGRVFIAGDAAHCHSPTGGQGMNSGIQDSFNLGWKLSLVHKGLAPPTLLDTYAEERLPIIAEMLGKTTELLNQTRTTREVKRGRELSQLGVNYRGSSILYGDDVRVDIDAGAGAGAVKGGERYRYSEDSELAARPGDRAPDAPGLVELDAFGGDKVVGIYDVLSPASHTVLVFSDAGEDHSPLFQVVQRLPERTVRLILVLPPTTTTKGGVESQTIARDEGEKRFDRILVDSAGHAYAGYHISQPTMVVIRPDGVVGARTLGSSGVERYFGGIFNFA